MPRLTLEERFLARIDFTTGDCWQWTGHIGPKGYSKFYAGPESKNTRAHRWAYEYFVGPIPGHLVLDHLCRNRSCVNPAHLEPVTIAENNRRGTNTGGEKKERCKRGHLLTPENSYYHRSDPQTRDCRACRRIRQRAYKRRRRERLNAAALLEGDRDG